MNDTTLGILDDTSDASYSCPVHLHIKLLSKILLNKKIVISVVSVACSRMALLLLQPYKEDVVVYPGVAPSNMHVVNHKTTPSLTNPVNTLETSASVSYVESSHAGHRPFHSCGAIARLTAQDSADL